MYKATVAVEEYAKNAAPFTIRTRQVCLHEVEADTADSLIQKINNVLGASLDI